MKYIFGVALTVYVIYFLTGCGVSSGVEEEVPSNLVEELSKDTMIHSPDIPDTFHFLNDTIVGYLRSLDTLVVVRDTYFMYRYYSGLTVVFDMDNSIIDRDSNYIQNWGTEDFNGDGFSDIRYSYSMNTPGVDRLLLFIPKSKTFEEVPNFIDFASAKKVGETGFYYSYRKAGCADQNWISKLFIIDELQCVEKGWIHGRGCSEKYGPTGIYTYRTLGVTRVPVDTFLRPQGHYEDKWEFIEEYWMERYTEFE